MVIVSNAENLWGIKDEEIYNMLTNTQAYLALGNKMLKKIITPKPHSKENKEMASLLQTETKRDVVFFVTFVKESKITQQINSPVHGGFYVVNYITAPSEDKRYESL